MTESGEEGILLLPVEVLRHITKYLPVEDVLSLSLTCHYMRNVINDNNVWKRHLPKVDLSYLRTLEQQVEPPFTLPLILTPVCQNWLNFMTKVHILNNWRQGNFKSYILQDGFYYSIPNGFRSAVKTKGQIIYGDNHIFVHAFLGQTEAIEVWNIENEPKIHSSLSFDSLHEEFFYIIGSNLVVFDFSGVKVHKITIPDKIFPLEHSFPQYPIGTQLHVSGHHLISIQPGQISFHIWDFLEQKKLGTFNLSDHHNRLFQSIPINLSVECSADNDIVLSFDLPDQKKGFVGFNILRKAFVRFEVELLCDKTKVLMDDEFVLIFTKKVERRSDAVLICHLYNYNTNKKLQERHFDDVGKNYDVKKAKIVNGKFVILCADSLELIDLKTLDTMLTVRCDSESYITETLDLLGSIFVIVCNGAFQLEMWDISNKRKCSDSILAGVNVASRIYINRSCTKMVCLDWVVGKIKIFNFW